MPFFRTLNAFLFPHINNNLLFKSCTGQEILTKTVQTSRGAPCHPIQFTSWHIISKRTATITMLPSTITTLPSFCYFWTPPKAYFSSSRRLWLQEFWHLSTKLSQSALFPVHIGITMQHTVILIFLYSYVQVLTLWLSILEGSMTLYACMVCLHFSCVIGKFSSCTTITSKSTSQTLYLIKILHKLRKYNYKEARRAKPTTKPSAKQALLQLDVKRQMHHSKTISKVHTDGKPIVTLQ